MNTVTDLLSGSHLLSIMPNTVDTPGMSRVAHMPLNVFEGTFNGVISDTSSAAECFVNQRFSAKLQAFLIGYVGSVTSDKSIFEQ